MCHHGEAGADGKPWWISLQVSQRSRPRQRALELVLQAVGNGKEFKPILSYTQSLDNLTKSA